MLLQKATTQFCCYGTTDAVSVREISKPKTIF
uniref:Uncharacterized protein n=1 Tax=Rhizophora mucronata TaxID=61149 RepID=A0A2P2PHV7_RHIMU